VRLKVSHLIPNYSNLKKMTKKIFICGCEKDGKIERKSVDRLIQSLEEKNIGYTYIEDLCGSVLKTPEALESLFTAEDALVFGCQSRAMQNLIDNSGKNSQENKTEYYHIDDEDGNKLVESVKTDNPKALKIKYADEWKPWYPVIDYERCNGCRKCLNFCLFSVYSVEDDGSVVVSASANCKDMCPACARVCPQNAIIFPKHQESPIDGGEGEMLSGDNVLEQIQNDDVYSVLSARRSNFKVSLLKKEQLKMAEEERKCCSTKEKVKEESSCDCDCDCKTDENADCACKDEGSDKNCCC